MFNETEVTSAFEAFVENFADENGLDMKTATKIIDWLGETGVLDYKEIKNVYV